MGRIRVRFADLIHARLRWSALQPNPQFLDRGCPALHENLDGTVRHIAGDAPEGEPSGFESGAVPEEDALNLPKDEETADDFVQGNWSASGVLRIRCGESGCSVTLGFHGGQPRSRELLRLQVRFGTYDVRLGCGKIRRSRARCARSLGGRDCLAGVAHFLHRGSSASDQAGNTDEYGKEAQHRVHGH